MSTPPTGAPLGALAIPGATLHVRATPKARRNAVETGDPGDPLKVWVTAPPDNGKANAAIRDLLAQALGVAPSRLTLVRGHTARTKTFQLD